MKKLLPTLLACCMAPLAAQAEIRINEVHYNVPGPDGNFEFIELKSTTNGVESCAGLTLLIIGNALSDEGTRLNPGEVLEALDLSDLSTGSNGLLLLGNGYTDTPVGGPWAGAIDPATAVGDPEGLGNSNIDYNVGLTILLVRDYDKVNGAKGADIDKDIITVAGSSPISTGNGVLDWIQTPPPPGALPALWTQANLVDSIGIRDVVDTRDSTDAGAGGTRVPYTTADISQTWATSTNRLTERDADTFARRLGSDTANSAAAWYGGQLREDSTNPTEVIYRTGRTFGPSNMVGEVTPGRANLSTGITTPVFRINEVGLNPSGNVNSDDRFQYVEIINTEGQARSLNGYWLLLVDSFDGSANANDNSPGVGAIIEEWNLSEFATGTNGLLLLGDGFSAGFTPFQDAVDPRTACGDPTSNSGPPASSSWGSRDLQFKDGFTLLLVKGYSPPAGKDIDVAPQDGIRDNTSFTPAIMDQIGFSQVAATTIGRTYSAVDLRTVMDPVMVPDNFSRKLGNLDNVPATAATAWYGGRYPGSVSPMSLGFAPSTPATEGGTFTGTWFGGFRGAATPGQANLAAAISPTAPPLASPIRINEVMLNPTNDAAGNDQANEYVELISTNESIAHLEGVWMLVVELEGAIGNIRTGSPLTGYTTGLNGLVLIGDGYDNTNNTYSALEGPLPAATAAFDPPVGMEQNDLPNGACAIILVRGIKGPITLNAQGKPIGDLDPENDGVLMLPTEYSDELLDSIAIAPVNPGASYGWIDTTTFLPHNIARYPGNYTANNPASWYGGQIPQTPGDLPLPLTNYAGQFFGNFQGAASPGRYNHAATPGPVGPGSVVFNELNINPAGADNNFEFIELLSTNHAARSLNGYTIVALDNQVSNTGKVRQAWSLDGMATGSNGLLMMGNGYTAGLNPWQSVIRPQTGLGDPPGRDGLNSSLGNGSIGGDTGNLNLAYLLVRNFSGFIEADLDEKSVTPVPGVTPDADNLYDTPGDGFLDSYPWQGAIGGILDSVLLRSYVLTVPPPTSTAAPYPWDGWTYGLANITSAFFPTPETLFYHVESIARFQGETTPNDPNAWYGGDLTGGPGGSSGVSEDYVTAVIDPTHPPRPDGFRGRVTPGQPNVVRNTSGDTDFDGVPNLVELAINTNPASAASASPLPAPTLITEAGQSYIGLAYPRIRSSAVPVPFPYAAEAYTYIVETSPDLVTWTADTGTGAGALIPVGTPVANADGVTETVTLRLPTPVTATPLRQFMRLRVTRR